MKRLVKSVLAPFSRRLARFIGVSSVSDRITQLEHRLEFLRRELLFELRYGGSDRGAQRLEPPKVLDPNVVALSDGTARVNLGCGPIPIEGFINIDTRELPGVDIVANVRRLPFDDGRLSELYSAHLLEHFPVEELARELLPYWYRLLAPGGRFIAVVPDADAMISEYVAGRFSFGDLRLVTFGEQEYDGDFHFNMFSARSLQHLLEDAGFVSVRIAAAARRNGACYEMEVHALKPLEPGVAPA